MEILKNDGGNGNGNGNGKEGASPQEQPQRKNHEAQMQEFAGKLNEILSEGYSLPAVLTVLESAVFEFRFALHMQQLEMAEREMKNKIQIPHMTIPTGKRK